MAPLFATEKELYLFNQSLLGRFLVGPLLSIVILFKAEAGRLARGILPICPHGGCKSH